MIKRNILIIEDDKAVRNLIVTALDLTGYHCLTAENGRNALLKAASYQPDVIILDLGLPDMNGVEVIRQIRTWSNLPIIVVSARSEDDDKIIALDSGADDYLTKPFSIPELQARLRVACRRVDKQKEQNEFSSADFINACLHVNYASQSVWVNDQEVHLTPNEYKLLVVLAKNAGKVMTGNTLQKEIWGISNISDSAALRVFIATLRKKLSLCDPDHVYIQTHSGVGYRMVCYSDGPENDEKKNAAE